MKLLFIANSRIPTERAMGTAIMKQCEAFAQSGIEVELVVPCRKNVRRENAFSYHGVSENFNITYLWSLDVPALAYVGLRFFLQRLTFFAHLCIYLFRSNADIVYAREPGLIALLPTRKSKFVELHHLYGLRLLGRFFLSRCAGIITITKALQEDVARIFSIPLTKMHIARSGVDLKKFSRMATHEDAKRALGIESKKPVAIYIGSLESWKGYETFLKASEYADDSVLYVVIGGSDDHIVELRKEYPRVLFLGFLPQAHVSMNQRAGDVLVAPNSAKELISARHTSPLKVFEYMASGVPIVASAVTSIEEVLSSRNALLVPPDNPEALAQGISMVTKDTAMAERIAVQAKVDVTAYDWSVRTQSLTGFIHGILSTRS